MTLWTGLREALATVGAATGVGPIFERLTASVQSFGASRKPVAFTVALIALSAKMAKADGIVSAEEVQMFRRVVEIPPEEEAHVMRLFDLAQRDIAGYDVYARRVVAIAEGDSLFLSNVIEGLFHIAAADGYVHEMELAFLESVGSIFGLDAAAFRRIAAGFVRTRGPDPYQLLGIDRDASDDAVKRQWRRMVLDCHPDRHFSSGLPAESMALLTDRLSALNAAYERIRVERGLA